MQPGWNLKEEHSKQREHKSKGTEAGIHYNCLRNSKRPTRMEHIVSNTKGGGRQIKGLAGTRSYGVLWGVKRCFDFNLIILGTTEEFNECEC